MPSEPLIFHIGTTIARELDRTVLLNGADESEREALARLRAPQGGSLADVLRLEPLATLARLSWRTMYPRAYAHALPTPAATKGMR